MTVDVEMERNPERHLETECESDNPSPTNPLTGDCGCDSENPNPPTNPDDDCGCGSDDEGGNEIPNQNDCDCEFDSFVL